MIMKMGVSPLNNIADPDIQYILNIFWDYSSMVQAQHVSQASIFERYTCLLLKLEKVVPSF